MFVVITGTGVGVLCAERSYIRCRKKAFQLQEQQKSLFFNPIMCCLGLLLLFCFSNTVQTITFNLRPATLLSCPHRGLVTMFF